jgi:hypothetical protein
VPNSIYQVAVYLTAALFVVLIIAGVASAFSGSVRRLLLARLGGAIYRAITQQSRAAEQEIAAKHANATALQAALGDLGDAVFAGRTAAAEMAAARARTICPETREALDSLLNTIRHVAASQEIIHEKLDRIRDSAAKCLDP